MHEMHHKNDLGFPFWTFAVGRLLIYIGSVFSTIAIPVAVLELSNQIQLSSLATTAVTLPYLLFGLLAGALVDRGAARKILIGSQLVVIIAVLSAAPAVTKDELNVLHLLAIAFCSGTCFVWFDAACFSMIPKLVSPERLSTANSILWSSGSIIEITTPILVSMCIVRFGSGPTILFDAAFCLIAVLVFSTIPSKTINTTETELLHSTEKHIWKEIRQGLYFIFTTQYIREMSVFGFFSAIANGGIIGLLVVFNKNLQLHHADLPLSPWAAIAIGSFLGALIIPIVSNRIHFGYITVFTLMLYPFLLSLINYHADDFFILVFLTGWGAAVSVVVLNGISTRQRLTPLNLQARVNTTGRMIAWGGTPIGALFVGFSADKWGIPATLNMMVIFTSLIVIFAFFSPLMQKLEGDKIEQKTSQ